MLNALINNIISEFESMDVELTAASASSENSRYTIYYVNTSRAIDTKSIFCSIALYDSILEVDMWGEDNLSSFDLSNPNVLDKILAHLSCWLESKNSRTYKGIW